MRPIFARQPYMFSCLRNQQNLAEGSARLSSARCARAASKRGKELPMVTLSLPVYPIEQIAGAPRSQRHDWLTLCVRLGRIRDKNPWH